MGGGRGLLGADPSKLEGAVFDRTLVRRVWRFARPYRWMLLAYLVTIVAQSLVQLVPPLLFRRIIDEAIGPAVRAAGDGAAAGAGGDRALLHVLAAFAVLAAL